MEFKIGDKVIIKEKLATNIIFDGGLATKARLQYAGKQATIVEKTQGGLFKLDIDGQRWSWSPIMLNLMWKFSLSEFKSKRISVTCFSKEESRSFLKIIESDPNFPKNRLLTYCINKDITCYAIQKHEFSSLYDMSFDTIYRFSDIIFHEPNDKECEKRNTMTMAELNDRGLKTGDIVFEKDKSIGIVINNWITYIDSVAWDDKSSKDIIRIIPVESIQETGQLPLLISKLFKNQGKVIDGELEQYIVDVDNTAKPKTVVKVYQVRFTHNGKSYDFLSHDANLAVGDFVECNGSNHHNRKYAKIERVEERALTDAEISCEYKYCRKG